MHEGASKIFFSKAREPRSSLLENSKWCGAPGPPIPWRVTGTAPAKNSFLAAGITPPIPRSWPPIVRGFRNNCNRKAQGNARNLPFILLAVCFTVYQFPHSLTVKSTRHFSYGAGLHLGLVYIYINILCLNVLHVRSSAPKHSLMFTFLQHGSQEHCEKGKGKTQPQQKAKEIGNLLNQSCQHFVRMAF